MASWLAMVVSARYIGLSLVAVIAAVVSWRHMNGLLATYGEDWFIAVIGPISIDGLMVVCSSALLAIADNIKKRALTKEPEPPPVPVPSPVPPKPKAVPALPPPTFRTGDDLLEAARKADAPSLAMLMISAVSQTFII